MAELLLEAGLVLLLVWWVNRRAVTSYRPPRVPEVVEPPSLPPYLRRGVLSGLEIDPVVRLGRRGGIRVHARGLEVQGAVGLPVDYRVRFSLPSGVPVRSRASRYRGPEGRLEARAVTAALRHPDATFEDLWIFVPFGAFDLESGLHDLSVSMEILVEGSCLVERRASFLLAQPEGRSTADGRVDPAEFDITDVSRPAALVCALCKERVVGAAWLCVGCEVAYHRECWDYAGGCATYGCGEKCPPSRDP